MHEESMDGLGMLRPLLAAPVDDASHN